MILERQDENQGGAGKMPGFAGGNSAKVSALANRVAAAHSGEYGTGEFAVAVAPGRFHLMGEHTWYFGGKTLSMAIDRYVCVSASVRGDDLLRFKYVDTGESKKINLSALRFRKEDKWANAIKCVIFGFVSAHVIERIEDVPGMDFCVSSEIQPSSGLGITTAMKVCAAYAINSLLSLECSDSEILAAIDRGNVEFLKEKNENHFAENVTAMFSEPGALVLTDHSKSVPFSSSSFGIMGVGFEGKNVLLVDAKVPRVSVWNESSVMSGEYYDALASLRIERSDVLGGWTYEDDRSEVNAVLSSMPEDIRRHLYAVMTEHRCVLDACSALSRNDYASFARSVNASHEAMTELYDISCPEIDWILKRLVEINPKPDRNHNPVCCGRITGQGFGRCLYAVLDDENIPEFNERLYEYTKIFGFKTSCYAVHPSAGVFVMRF